MLWKKGTNPCVIQRPQGCKGCKGLIKTRLAHFQVYLTRKLYYVTGEIIVVSVDGDSRRDSVSSMGSPLPLGAYLSQGTIKEMPPSLATVSTQLSVYNAADTTSIVLWRPQ
jgi:hypothetical protein